MRQYFRITGHEELRRDAESMGIVNVDRNALNKFREERELKRKLAQIAQEHDQLKNDVGEMKSMLALILSKMGN